MTALRACDDAGDYLTRGQVRRVLRSLRGDQQAAFDQAWQQSQPILPAWLHYLGTADQLSENIVAWLQAPDWPASQAYLLDHAGLLLTDQAEAALEHLIDANPGTDELREHLDLLRAARAHGPHAAYAARQEHSQTQHRVQLLRAWISTRTWEASGEFAAASAAGLLDPATQATLAAFGDQDPRDPAIRLHRGLLGYAAAAGFGAAYQLLSDPAGQPGLLADPETAPEIRLALGRLRSGQASDDPEAHFRLATAALLAGVPEEAAAAAADCADNAAPYEKRDYARRLDELAAENPGLAPLLPPLAQILRTSQPPRPAGDNP